MDEAVVLAFVVVGDDGEVVRIEVRDDGVDDARSQAIASAGSDGYVLAVTAHSLARVRPEPQIELTVDGDGESGEMDQRRC